MPPRATPSSPAAALDGLPAARRAIVLSLRRLGEAGAAELGEALAITAGAVRQQLRPMVAEGWLEYRDVRPGPGRPRRRYRLSARATALFPHAYDDLAVDLLGHVAAEDPEMIERAFARRARARAQAARGRLEGRDLPGRVRELARILDEQGYMADADAAPDGALHLVERNCAILAVAREHRCACASELAFLREVLPGTRVERVRHIAGGDVVCRYEVRPTG